MSSGDPRGNHLRCREAAEGERGCILKGGGASPRPTVNYLSLSADFFVLAGAILQVGGKFWVRRVARRPNRITPAGYTGIDFKATEDNYDVFSFLAIGVGSIYFILNDSGFESPSDLLLALCVVEALIIMGTGFESYSVLDENSESVMRWQVWPVHMNPFIILMVSAMGMVVVVGLSMAIGYLDPILAVPLLVVASSLTVYLFHSLKFRTVRPKTHRSMGYPE